MPVSNNIDREDITNLYLRIEAQEKEIEELKILLDNHVHINPQWLNKA